MTARIDRPGDRLRLAAVAILIAGILAAVFVYIAASGQDDTDALGYRVAGGQSFAIGNGDSSRELQQLERLGGKAAVQTFKFQRWFSSIWRGQRLAYTLVVLGAAVALACWHLASLMDEPRPS
jgi:hypothetical protein